jgi:hypothetical protein
MLPVFMRDLLSVDLRKVHASLIIMRRISCEEEAGQPAKATAASLHEQQEGTTKVCCVLLVCEGGTLWRAA